MNTPVRGRDAMISGMNPALRPGLFAFVTQPEGAPRPGGTIASFSEAEGVSLIVPLDAAPATALPMRCITLQVRSALEGVGLTAAVSTALADRGIPANVVAAFHHDHVFVPADMADRALAALKDLQRSLQTDD